MQDCFIVTVRDITQILMYQNVSEKNRMLMVHSTSVSNEMLVKTKNIVQFSDDLK